MNKIESRTILFIHGAFVNNRAWANWETFFTNEGYTCHAPAWPHKDDAPAALRAQHPHTGIAKLTLSKLVAHYREAARALPEKPIIIGHSLGGLISQILLSEGVAAAAVAVNSAAPLGVLGTHPKFLSAALTLLGPFSSVSKSYLMPLKDWGRLFTNGMPVAVQQQTLNEFLVPESRRALRGVLSPAAKVQTKKPHPPLLLIAGEKDNIFPPAVIRQIRAKYKDKSSITDFKVFSGRTHFILGQEGWEEVAGYVRDWINRCG